jgi:hypothetical protein
MAVVIYSVNDGSIRSIILPDTGAQGKVLAIGEAALTLTGPSDLASCRAAVQAVRGVPCASGRCVVVSAGVVVDTYMGDPQIDTHPRGQLVSSDDGIVSDHYDGTQLTRQMVIVNQQTSRVVNIIFLPLKANPGAGNVMYPFTTPPFSPTLQRGDVVVISTGPPATVT